ncbi:MAG: hypothetical protein SOV28_05670, partial [Bacteroidaceae bacterium]|nr:hypothetical protein [Paraprevotella sp.]MDY2716133.1 hypothetical protein [Bacteroidaceae bacterium]
MRINKRYAMMLAALLCVANTFAVTTVKVKKAGTLGILLTQAQQDTCTSLAIKGKLNSDDIRILRRMAGYKEDGCSTGQLHTLNLAEAEFVTDKEPYMVLDAKEAMLAVVANPEFGIAPQFALGEPLQNNHVIHYERYQNREWRDYSNYKWNGGMYINRTELMQAKRSSVSYNGSYYLGRGIEKPFQVINDQFF